MPVYDGEHVKYTYNSKNQVSAITTNTTEYTFTYDSYGNTKTIKAGDETLATYNYNPNNGKLQSLVYGNGTTVEYVYDELDRIEEIWYTEGSTETLKYRYTYTADGNLHTVEDLDSGEGHMYSYDSEGRMSGYIKYSLSDSTIDTSSDYMYDERSRLYAMDISFVYTAGTSKTCGYLGYWYTYNDDDALTDLSINLANPGEEKVTLKYTYDNLYRLSGKTYSYQSGYTNTVGYVYKDRGTSYTTGQVSQYSTKVNSNTTTTYTYTYDMRGNITRIVDNNGKVTKYYYDDIGQLTREDNPYLNKSYSYTYDKNGNRISKSTYQYTTAATLPSELYQSYEYWQYGNDDWGDQLTGYMGTPITYDEIGNPLTYSNYEFEWENGRQLKKITVGLGMSVYEYTYNDEGIRTSKKVTGTTHYYTLNGSQILTEQFGNIFIVYLYDESGSPIGMQYRTNSMAEGTFYTYLFEKNLQGDIIAVYNTSGTKLISYVYDAWGNVTVTNHNVSGTNSGARHNPFRYRGYYYDTETGYYYLQSRYYNPEWGRFISPDSFDIIGSTTDDLYDNNLYSYCDNNPVMRVDDGGEFWHILAGAAVGSIINGTMKIISNAIEGKSLTSGLGIAMLSGAASGALGSMGIGIGVIIAGNAAISMSENAINQIIDNNGFDNFNVGDMLFDGMVGGISGGIGGAGTGSKYLTNLGYQTVKRTFKSTFHSGIKTGLKEAGKAFSYYGKSTTKYYKKFLHGIRDNVITSAVTSTVTSSYTKSQYRRFIDYLERNT